MTKLKLTLTVLMLLTAAAWGQSSLGGGGLAISCNAVTATGACTSFALQAPNGQLPGAFTWQVIPTGSPSAISTTLEGSIDGNTWTTLDTSTNTSGEVRSVTGKPIRLLRCNLGTLTNGTNPTVTCQFTVTTSSAGGGGSGAGSGTVTNTGTLTANALVLGNGGADTKVSTGLTTNGTAGLNLGSTGVGGTLTLFGGTSGSQTFTAPGNGTQLNLSATTVQVGTTSGTIRGGTGNLTIGSSSANLILAPTAGDVEIKSNTATAVNKIQLDGLFGAATQQSVALCETNGAPTTLSTVATTTNTGLNCLPANSIIDAVVARVTTTITAACTGWELGDGTIPARFSANDTTLTANETQIGFLQADQTGTSGPRQVTAAPVQITCAGGNPGAGAVRVEVFYHTWVAPTS